MKINFITFEAGKEIREKCERFLSDGEKVRQLGTKQCIFVYGMNSSMTVEQYNSRQTHLLNSLCHAIQSGPILYSLYIRETKSEWPSGPI